jgi:hypothetical protein
MLLHHWCWHSVASFGIIYNAESHDVKDALWTTTCCGILCPSILSHKTDCSFAARQFHHPRLEATFAMHPYDLAISSSPFGLAKSSEIALLDTEFYLFLSDNGLLGFLHFQFLNPQSHTKSMAMALSPDQMKATGVSPGRTSPNSTCACQPGSVTQAVSVPITGFTWPIMYVAAEHQS